MPLYRYLRPDNTPGWVGHTSLAAALDAIASAESAGQHFAYEIHDGASVYLRPDIERLLANRARANAPADTPAQPAPVATPETPPAAEEVTPSEAPVEQPQEPAADAVEQPQEEAGHAEQ